MEKFMRVKYLFFLLLAVLFLSRIDFVLAQDPRQELNSLIQETQKKSDRIGEMSFVWWIPQEYWQLSFSQNPTITPEQAEKVLEVFRPYIIVAVVDGKTGSMAGITYRGEAEIRSSIKLKDKMGNIYLPLSDSEVSVDTKSFLGAMKPVLANVLGPMGQNMYFFVFSTKDKSGEDIANAKKEGRFSVELDGNRSFLWTLPLSSLIPLKVCPTCNQKLNGAYKFCPWDGTKLE
jgi:hypothetical protein